jgi:chorismate lyase
LRAAVGDEEECLQAAAVANTSVSLLGGNPPGDAVDDVQKLREECLGMKKVWSCRGERPSVVSSRLMRNLSPAWKMMLLSDGSVTRHVELLTGGDVKVECLEMKTCNENENENENLLVPPEVSAIPGPVIQRQVLLYSESVAEPCVYAVSWWNEAKAEAFLTDVKSPIWVNLSDNKTELFREVKTLYEGHSPQLERRMGVEGPFWARHYCFWHGDELLTVIFEAFSNKLDDYLSDDLCA